MSDTSRQVVRSGCLGSVWGCFVGALVAGVLGALIGVVAVATSPSKPDPHLFPFLHPSAEQRITGLACFAAFPGAFVGAVLGAIAGARRAVAKSEKTRAIRLAGEMLRETSVTAEPTESPEQELVRLQKRVEKLKDIARNEAIQRKNGA